MAEWPDGFDGISEILQSILRNMLYSLKSTKVDETKVNDMIERDYSDRSSSDL